MPPQGAARCSACALGGYPTESSRVSPSEVHAAPSGGLCGPHCSSGREHGTCPSIVSTWGNLGRLLGLPGLGSPSTFRRGLHHGAPRKTKTGSHKTYWRPFKACPRCPAKLRGASWIKTFSCTNLRSQVSRPSPRLTADTWRCSCHARAACRVQPTRCAPQSFDGSPLFG